LWDKKDACSRKQHLYYSAYLKYTDAIELWIQYFNVYYSTFTPMYQFPIWSHGFNNINAELQNLFIFQGSFPSCIYSHAIIGTTVEELNHHGLVWIHLAVCAFVCVCICVCLHTWASFYTIYWHLTDIQFCFFCY